MPSRRSVAPRGRDAADPTVAVASALESARRRSETFRSEEARCQLAMSATAAALMGYWKAVQEKHATRWAMVPCPLDTNVKALDPDVAEASRVVARAAVGSDPLMAGYLVGELYTSLLPPSIRSERGVFYTPPALVNRVIALGGDAGVDWATATVLDPACGGGAFLTPVALQILSALKGQQARTVLQHVVTHLRGFEIDPFGAWMTQVLLEAALDDLCRKAGERLPKLVTTCDALRQLPAGGDEVDLVVGNPPFGRVAVPADIRQTYARSIYGHANIYALFMDHALRWTRPGGVVAFITPTGFLGGEYFSRLRALLLTEAMPVTIDFVTSRRGVFSDVLQETLLATYRRGETRSRATVSVLRLTAPTDAAVERAGEFLPPAAIRDPWLIPRSAEQVELVAALRGMTHRLRDYGYRVSTGPLVWNRHKDQLTDKPARDARPIIWSESVTPTGEFKYRVEKRNHRRYLLAAADQDWLLLRSGCVLVQRTTAKEQRRRLIAAELPHEFVTAHGPVSVENHLNIIRETGDEPDVLSRGLLAVLLNSPVIDSAFRCISGSVAVSASELEFLPLPDPDAMGRLRELFDDGRPAELIHGELARIYSGDVDR